MLPYRAIHEDCDCKTYQRRLQDEAETSEDAKKTQQFLDVSTAVPRLNRQTAQSWQCG